MNLSENSARLVSAINPHSSLVDLLLSFPTAHFLFCYHCPQQAVSLYLHVGQSKTKPEKDELIVRLPPTLVIRSSWTCDNKWMSSNRRRTRRGCGLSCYSLRLFILYGARSSWRPRPWNVDEVASKTTYYVSCWNYGEKVSKSAKRIRKMKVQTILPGGVDLVLDITVAG